MATKTYVAWLNDGPHTDECEFELDEDLSDKEVAEKARDHLDDLIAMYIGSGWRLKEY